MSGEQPDYMRKSSRPESGAILRRYPGVLQVRSAGSILTYVTRAASVARRAKNIRRQAEQSAASGYLSHVGRTARLYA